MSATKDIFAVEMTKVLSIRLALIRPFAGQPRAVFDQDALLELAASIKEHGQQIPVIVRELVGDERGEHHYELIDGERRYRACTLLGLAAIRCELRGAKDEHDQFLQSVVANSARREHTPLESALICARISAMPEFAALPAYRRADKIGKICGRSGQWVENMLRLATLPDGVKEHLGAGRMNAQIAQFLCAVKDPEEQTALAATIVERQLKPPVARNLIRDALAKNGRPAGRHSWPSDSTGRIEGQLNRIAEIATTLAETPRRGLGEALARRPTLRATMLASIDRALQVLGELRKGIADFAPARSAPKEASRG